MNYIAVTPVTEKNVYYNSMHNSSGIGGILGEESLEKL